MRLSYAMGAALLFAGCVTFHSSPELAAGAIFVQAELEMVDVLWVVDDSSPYMIEVQQRLGEAVPALDDPLFGLDVQMMVVPTTLGPPTPAFAWSGDSTDAALLALALQVGAAGSDQERGLQAAVNALEGFVRPEGHLVVVFVSDEEDCSDDGRLSGETGTACYTAANRLVPIQDFVHEFLALHGGLLNRTTVVSIGATETSACPEAVPQERYARVARATGGATYDICALDFTEPMRAVGEFAAGLRQGFRLPQPALPTTLEAYIDGQPVDAFEYLPRNWLVQFEAEAVPPAGSLIELFYEIDGMVFSTDP